MQKVFIKPIANLPAARAFVKALYEEYLHQDENFVVLLEGGLGVGKTFLVREWLQCFGVASEITSPTYALVNEYENNVGQSFAHFDFYRLETPEDFFARGFTDIAEDRAVHCFVEWPEKISELALQCFSGTVYQLRLEFGDDPNMRTVTLCR